MAARPLVAQGPLDQEEKGRGKPVCDKPRGGDAHKSAASESEQFLGDQARNTGADRAADHAIFGAPCPPRKSGYETGPADPQRSLPWQRGLDKFPVEVQEASGRNGNFGQALPDPCRLQQVCRRKDSRIRRLVFQKRYRVSSATAATFSFRPWPSPGWVRTGMSTWLHPPFQSSFPLLDIVYTAATGDRDCMTITVVVKRTEKKQEAEPFHPPVSLLSMAFL